MPYCDPGEFADCLKFYLDVLLVSIDDNISKA